MRWMSLLLPMPPNVVPLVSDRIPMVRDPVLAAAFEDPRAGVPLEKTAIPFPKARRPNVPIAMWRLVFDTGRRRGHVADDVGSRGRKPRREQRAGNKQCRQQGHLHFLHIEQPLSLTRLFR